MYSSTSWYSDHSHSLRRYRRAGTMLIAAFASTFGIWAAIAPLSSAVVASGHFEVEGNIKKIQHKAGGVVSQILVHEGQRVAGGQALLRLDDTNARSELQIVEHQLAELQMSAARLGAERDGAVNFELPSYFVKYSDPMSARILFNREQELLDARLKARQGQKQQLTERVTQLMNQIDGLTLQESAKRHEHQLLDTELRSLRSLLDRQLVLVSQVKILERNMAQLDGEIGQLQASTAEIRAKIAETKLQMLNLDQIAVAEAGKDLAETESKINELSEKQIEAKDALTRVSVRSPLAGVVHELSVHTVGGVVGAGEVLMMIVPEMAELNVELRISPQEVDSIHVGDKTYVRISGLNRSTTPDLEGKVEMIGADLVEDTPTRISYYPVRVHLPPGELDRLTGTQVVPGMPVEAFITTSKRTFLDYLWEPLSDRLRRAIREH
ncbi:MULTISPECIES: HlyD family type I secretion periplasmic adaptor subunit [unclassified Rhizobium]|uniref:HlyD family type I secretion periplasmic adaptor subunit n=1 Tax=unclassified Rhizobium TaxID=2613769 RepID=UPI0021671A10|nr:MULTISPECIES: HlyD family type I secretion periplasmic adaptor subunit [unclassified Rhizobium]MCS3744358.1 HlyD family secretion protein [Rhizobium sp. BK661]MCS4096641.1 HlyD family secretion protein [Rhizobium sp. BK176]